jgi:hypothetical protein
MRQTMNLAQVIHQRWAATEALSSLLPAARVYTGMSVDPSRPFAVISKESHRPLESYNDGAAVDVVGVRIRVFHDDYTAAAAVVAQIKAAFDRSEFALSGSDKVLAVERADDAELQTDDGVWQLTVDFKCTVYLAAGT